MTIYNNSNNRIKLPMQSNVNDIALYVIYSSINQGYEISNLKLQKLLYFFFLVYYKKFRKYLFNDSFSAWKFGPVQVDIYFNYYMYGASPIDDIDFSSYNAANLNDEIKKFIDNEINDFADYSIYDLVNETHKEGCAWSRVFDNGEGNNHLIPFNYIVDDIDHGR